MFKLYELGLRLGHLIFKVIPIFLMKGGLCSIPFSVSPVFEPVDSLHEGKYLYSPLCSG